MPDFGYRNKNKHICLVFGYSFLKAELCQQLGSCCDWWLKGDVGIRCLRHTMLGEGGTCLSSWLICTSALEELYFFMLSAHSSCVSGPWPWSHPTSCIPSFAFWFRGCRESSVGQLGISVLARKKIKLDFKGQL